MARVVFQVVLAAGMTTAVPFLHRERSVTLGARTGLRKGEHRKDRANHMVLVDEQRDGAHGAREPGQVPPPLHLDFARIGWLRCFMVLALGRGRVPVVDYRQVCLGLQPLARLVHELYMVE